MTRETGPGVPEALPRTLLMLGERLGPESLDRLWIFPPLVRGRKERGLVAASRFHPGDEDRRLLFTAPYVAERTGKGLELECTLEEQGEAPPDRLPRVMYGVVSRSGDELGEAREVELGGDPARFRELLEEFDPALLGEVGSPAAGPEPPPAPERQADGAGPAAPPTEEEQS